MIPQDITKDKERTMSRKKAIWIALWLLAASTAFSAVESATGAHFVGFLSDVAIGGAVYSYGVSEGLNEAGKQLRAHLKERIDT